MEALRIIVLTLYTFYSVVFVSPSPLLPKHQLHILFAVASQHLA